MVELIKNAFLLAIALKIGIWILKFIFIRKYRRRSAIFYRIKKIISNAICRPLDMIIQKQEEKKKVIAEDHQQLPSNIIRFPNTQ